MAWGLFLATTALAVPGCDKMPLLAPSGSTVALSSSTSIVQANGTAEIRATVLESSGTPVQNGTTVTFSTNLGAVSPIDARTVNGVASAQFIPNGQSGVAKINATSGGAKQDTSSNPLTITVGGAAAGHVQVTANPNHVGASGGITTITAVVTDTNGNPLTGVAVSFSTDAGSLSSSSAFTGSTGQATTTLATNKDATVTATTGTTAGTGTVKVTVGVLPTLAFGTISPTNPTPGQNVTIPLTVTTTGATDAFADVTVNFGDGQSRSLGALTTSTPVSHAYTSDGVYTVTATGVSASGDHTQAVTQVAVSPRVPISVIVSPTTATVNTSTTFTATATPSTNISSYTWNFGDGTGYPTTGPQTSHTYTSTGNFTLTVSVATVDGNSGNTIVSVRVN
jgi:adhesin/invasin